MKLIQYKVKPDQVADNERLIADVFRELEAKAPEGVRYLVLALPDGTFVHIAEGDVAALDSHRAFRTGINDRCLETPRTMDAKVIGWKN